MRLILISAMGKNQEIGLKGTMPWRLSADLKHFKELTMGAPLIMGRKTLESLPGLLPGREHLVLSRSGYQFPNVKVFASPAEVLAYLEKNNIEKAFIAGGGEVYELFRPYATELMISQVDYEGEADTFFPEWNFDSYRIVEEKIFLPEKGQPAWVFKHYLKN